MRYTLIELRKCHGAFWNLTISPDEADREFEDRAPHELGFYNAPRRQTVQTSFEELRRALINHRRKMIKTLQREVEELESLELPDVPKRPTKSIYHKFVEAR